MREHLLGRTDIARVKRSELGIFCTRLIKPHFIDDVLQKGADKANIIASKKIKEIKKIIGF